MRKRQVESMNVVQEIRTAFANVREGAMLPVVSGQTDSEAWVFREDGRFGVAVPLNSPRHVLEFFAGARLNAVERDIGGHIRTLLRLDSGQEALRNEFAVLCAQFIELGIGRQTRAHLISDPLAWWDRWRQLLGNTNRDQQTYSTLGELLTLERLLSQSINAKWIGPLKGSVDIEATGRSYEVKSTLSRYGSVVHIAGQFQLNRSRHNPLYLIHHRFEPSTAGDSINSVVLRLIDHGLVEEELEALLSRIGLHAGGAARTETYRQLESIIYEIDENFPSITPSSFRNNIIPAGIVSIEYDVDLSTLQGQPF